MRVPARRLEALTVTLVVMLASMTCLGAGSEVPEVDPSEIEVLDEGQEVITRGLLVDLRRYDSGFETVVIASPEGGTPLRVFVTEGLRPQPSTYARIGDSLRIAGTIANSGFEAVLYSHADAVSLEARSEDVLTLGLLIRHWQLFVGDQLSLRGTVMRPLASEGCRLYDACFQHSIALEGAWEEPGSSIAAEVVVSGTLRLDERTMALFLAVSEVLPGG